MPLKNRFNMLYLLFVVFAAFSFLIRTMLLIKALPNVDLNLVMAAKTYAVGFFYDCVTFSYVAVPFALYVTLLPDRIFKSNFHKYAAYLVFFLFTYVLLFDAVAEYLFFDEFGVRFNFIAVDYLIYTHEVIGNIKESYPLYWIFGTIFVMNVFIFLFIKKYIDRSLHSIGSLRHRLTVLPAFIILSVLSYFFVDLSYAKISQNTYANELAENGIYDLFAAFRNNELDYNKFYAAKDDTVILAGLKELLKEKNNNFVVDGVYDIERNIKNGGAEKKLNVIVIVEESLSAEYLGAFGNKKGLTPNLDKIAGESMFFTGMYATGTRTIRGLEAIALSIPPLPGTSLVKRPHNENFFSWGSLMKTRGYDNRFIYGGFGYFDNMNYFFSHNGFDIVDRTRFDKNEITFANIWGVCDEDLFKKVIKEANKSYALKRPFFSIVMTTSNHRPFTYPEGRIDIPSHSGREGGVKYADYAIGKFIESVKGQPWFKDTVIVIVADHCASSAGKMDLPVKRYEIPMLIYAPYHIKPQRVDKVVSQIDIAPTILGMLNFSYNSKFFGKDILKMDDSQQRAFISTYEKLGFLKDDRLVVLGPKKEVKMYRFDKRDGKMEVVEPEESCVNDALSYYQGVNYVYKHRLNRIEN